MCFNPPEVTFATSTCPPCVEGFSCYTRLPPAGVRRAVLLHVRGGEAAAAGPAVHAASPPPSNQGGTQ